MFKIKFLCESKQIPVHTCKQHLNIRIAPRFMDSCANYHAYGQSALNKDQNYV